MVEVRWERYPKLAACRPSRTWLQIQANLGLARNTIEAYGRALEDYLAFTSRSGAEIITAGREHISAYVRDLSSRRNPKRCNVVVIDSGAGLANATLQQRLTAIRLFYDYLIEEGLRTTNPVGRGRYTRGKGFGGIRERGLIPRYSKLPWIPNDTQWRAVLEATRFESLRNRLMLSLSYDSALRREELCSLRTGDIDPSHSTVTIRAENTKSRKGRVVPYSRTTAGLLAAYLPRRRELTRDRGPLFISESRRNRGRPLSIWTWSKIVENISERSGVAEFTTHTPRHLCLTDLARANWDIHEIAEFAGHKSIQTTLLYIHLSGRDLARKLVQGMAQIHAWRAQMMKEIFSA
jgi:integrase/recombinase XerD